MRSNSQAELSDIYIISAALAAHATSPDDGFRQKDIKFMIEMLSNWMDMTIRDSTLSIHNTQVMRYLDYLVKEGWAKSSKKLDVPRYRLTPIGLLTLASKLVNRTPQFPLESFYFVFHFLETYRPPIQQLLLKESRQLPSAIRIELDFLLNIPKLLDRQIQFVEHEHRKLKQRMADSQIVTKLVKKFRYKKKSSQDLVEEIEKQFPYDLNSQKKLSEFYGEMPETLRDFILDVAIEKRANQIWAPILSVLDSHLKILNDLKEGLKKAVPRENED